MLLIDELKKDFQRRKEKNNRFSLRAYSSMLGVSASQLSLWLRGLKNPGMSSFKRIESHLNLSQSLRKRIIDEIITQQKSNQQAKGNKRFSLRPSQHELVSRWEAPAILSLARFKKNKYCPLWISKQLGITKEVAEDMLGSLEKHGLIEKHQSGFKPRQNGIFAEAPNGSKSIRAFHNQVLQIAQGSIESCPPEERYLMALTVPSGKEGLEEVKSEIKYFCNRVARITEKYDDAQKVYQLAVQYFPLNGEKI